MNRSLTTLAFALILAPLGAGCAADVDDEALEEEVGEAVGDEASALNSFGGNCADPAMIRSGSMVYMTCTGGGPNGGTRVDRTLNFRCLRCAGSALVCCFSWSLRSSALDNFLVCLGAERDSFGCFLA